MSSDGTMVATGGANGKVRLFSVNTTEQTHTLETKTKKFVMAVDFVSETF